MPCIFLEDVQQIYLYNHTIKYATYIPTNVRQIYLFLPAIKNALYINFI